MILRCAQSSPPLFSALLGNASHPTFPRPPSAGLPFGGDGHQVKLPFSIYHVGGPFIRDLNLTAGWHFIVEGDTVPFEAKITLEAMNSVGRFLVARV